MGTRRDPPIIRIECATRHNVWALRISCICGNAVIIPILVAHWRFGPGMWLSKLQHAFRCTKCEGRFFGNRSLLVSIEPVRRPLPDHLRHPNRRPRLGPCE